MNNKFKPFENDSQTIDIDNLTIDNGVDGFVMHGEVVIEFTQKGLDNLMVLQEIIDKGVQKMMQAKLKNELPATLIARDPNITTKKNPFA